MKLMTLNVWQGRLERAILAHVKTLGLDFACMQEAVDYDGNGAWMVTPYKTIGESMQLSHHYFSPLMALKFGQKDLTFGNATYAKLPFSQTNTVFTRGQFKDNFSFDTDDYNIRAFQHVVVQVGNKTLHVLNHHGHHIDTHKQGDEETLRQVAQIADYIQQLKGAVILCGDFNLAPESESVKHLSASLRNLSVEYELQTTRSALTFKNEVCDYIFVSQDVQVHSFSMDETIISDHNALLLDFDIM